MSEPTTEYDVEAEIGSHWPRRTMNVVVTVHQRPDGGFAAKSDRLGAAEGPTWLAAVRELLRQHSYEMRVAKPRGAQWRLS